MRKSKSRIQGEGDYESGRRFNKESRQFVATHDVEKLGRASKPRSAKEAAELKRAEAKGKSRAKK